MKKLSKNELEKLAGKMFEYHKSVDKFLATEDGQFFTEPNKSAASLHARSNKLELVEFTRDGETKKADPDPNAELPNDKWKKDDIQKWMTEHEIPVDEKASKAELLKKIDEALN